jgi:DNA-binding transcriptional regulator YiaG
MTLQFRNLTVTPDAPVSTWPTEAIATALGRGDLDDWRRIVAELKADPWGRTARQVEEVLRHTRPYGVAALFETVLSHTRAVAETEERNVTAEEIRTLIAASGLSRSEFASRIGTSASRLSTYATGKVTPSATLLLRMRRLAERSREGQAPQLRSGQGTIPGPVGDAT